MPITARDVCLLRNFRPSANQGVRDALDLVLLPHLKAALPVVSDLKEPEVYFETLKNSFGCLAYGGNFHCDFSRNEVLMQLEEVRSASIYFQFVVEPVILRWDSWRFWESLAAGCLTFHLDFEKYGFVLPVMPQAWVHYVPIDLSDPKGTVSTLMDRWDELSAIAAQGRLWAREHYSPEAVAYRFLDYALGNLPMPEALTPEMLERENQC